MNEEKNFQKPEENIVNVLWEGFQIAILKGEKERLSFPVEFSKYNGWKI